MLHVLYGVDSFSRHEAVAALRAELDADGMLATNTNLLDGRRVSLDELIMVCDALPFLGTHRLVHVRGLLPRAESERPAAGRRGGRAARPTAPSSEEAASGWLALAAYVDRMPPTTALLLEDGDVRSTNPLLVALSGKGRLREFSRLSDRAIEAWIGERARRRGLLFEGAALRLLAESVPVEIGEDGQWHALWALTSEMEKLNLYATGERITERDVRRLVPSALESRIYALTDAVTEGSGAHALTVLEELLSAGRPAPVLLAALAGRYRQLLLVRSLREEGVPARQIQARLGIRSDHQFDRLRQTADRIPPARLEAAYQRLLHADRSIKLGRTDDMTALETLVTELTG